MKQKNNKNRSRLAVGFIALLYLLLLSGCADEVTFTAAETATKVGFWYGLWHGMIFPTAFFVSLFSDDTAVYAIYNSGGWYDFGFFLGLGSSIGGSSAASKR